MDSPPSAPEPTEALVQAAKAGDVKAWRELDRRHRNTLSLFVRGRIPEAARRRFDTEDVLQSAFLSAFRELDSYEYQGKGSFQAWLARILENRLRDRVRRQQTQKREAADERYTDRLHGSAAEASSPSEIFSSAEQHARLVAAIAELPDDLREVLSLHYIDKKTLAQVAEELDVSVNTVSRRAARAVEEVYKILRSD